MTVMAIVADVQVGHEAALWPEKFKRKEDNSYLIPSKSQKIL